MAALTEQASGISAALQEEEVQGYITAHWQEIDLFHGAWTALEDALREDEEAQGDLSTLRGSFTEIADRLEGLGYNNWYSEGFRELKEQKRQEGLETLGTFQGFDQPPVTGKQKVAAAALELEGKLRWINPKGQISQDLFAQLALTYHDRPLQEVEGNVFLGNDFNLWLKGDLEELNDHSLMNCWEGVLYAAFRAGVVDKERLQHLYPHGEHDLTALNPALGLHQALSLLQAIDAGIEPGDLVVWGVVEPLHVAISLGGKSVMSLWHKPGPLPSFAQTTIPEIQLEEGASYPLESVVVIKDPPIFQ